MNPENPPVAPRGKPAQIVWWVLWFAMLNGLMTTYYLLGRKETPLAPPAAEATVLDYIGLAPLFISVVLRWVVIGRVRQAQAAFVVFIIGLALAENCGILAIFLGHALRKEMVTLSLLGLLQWAPLFARRFYDPPASPFREPV